MNLRTSTLNRDTKSYSSSKHHISPHNDRSHQLKQSYDYKTGQSQDFSESGIDPRRFQSAQKVHITPFMENSNYSSAVSQYIPSEYDGNEEARRKENWNGQEISNSLLTVSSKGDGKFPQGNSSIGSKYSSVSEKKNPIPRGNVYENKDRKLNQSNFQQTNKSFSAMGSPKVKTPAKKGVSPTTSAKKGSNRKDRKKELELDFHHEEAVGEEKFMNYTRDVESEMDQISQRLESSIRKDFERTAHNILYGHVNKLSSIEKDDIFRDRDSKNNTPRDIQELNFTQQSPYRSVDYNKRINLSVEKNKGIPEESTKEVRRTTPQRQERKSATAAEAMNSRNWASSDKKTSLNVSIAENNPKPGYYSESKKKKEYQLRKSLADKALEKQILIKDKYSSAKKEDLNKQEEYSLKKPNQRVQTEVEPEMKPRYVLSPSVRSLDTGSALFRTGQLESSYGTGKDMNNSVKQGQDIYANLNNLDNLQAEQKITKLQEISVQLIKENHYEDALEYLLEADVLIRNELPANHPEQIYVYYLLGECYVKKEDYHRAQKVLENAIHRYEEKYYYQDIESLYFSSENVYGRDSTYACYYLGLLVLQSHVYMSTKQYRDAQSVYKKLIQGVENYCQVYDRQNLRGIIPHILLIKYNLAECLRSLQKREEADIVFHEVVTKFNMEDREHLENFGILLIIAEHFMNRQNDNLALDVLQRVCEIGSSKQDLQKSDQELISLIHDEIATILFNRKEHLNAAKYYELSFKLKVKVFGMKHLKVGYLLLALGKAYYMASEHHKALHRFSSGLDVIESIEGRNTIYSANISLTMAKIQYALKEYHRSIYLYERSLEIYSHIMGSAHPYCLRIYANLIYVCFECRQQEKTLEIAQRLLSTIKKINNAEVFTMLNEIGNIYRKNNFFQEALNFYETALEKLADVNQKEISTEAVNLVYTNIGSANFHLEKYEEALQYYKEAAKYFSQVDNGVNAHLVSIYVNIVRLFKVLGKSNDAGIYLKKATAILGVLEGEIANKKNDESVHKLKSDLSALKKS